MNYRIGLCKQEEYMSETVNFQPIDLRSASEHEYQCLAAFQDILDKERFPDDPPTPLEERIQDWKNIPAFVEFEACVGWNGTHSEVLAYCEIGMEHTGSNEHIAFFTLRVHPQHRCQGLGQKMLKMIFPFATEHKCSLLMVWSNDRIPAAETFLEHRGARRGQEGKVNQLKISEVDHDLIARWSSQSKHLEREFELGLWDGPFPEEHIEEIAALLQEMANDQPRDDLEIEDMKFTPEMIRQFEQNMQATGDVRWVLYIIDRARQKLAGWTEVHWHPTRAMILEQGFTAVDASYRNKGLGRWLKAEMMTKILQEKPQVELIRTRNANSNAPMLKINNEMGFKPYSSITAWQVNTDQVENYLKEKGLL